MARTSPPPISPPSQSSTPPPAPVELDGSPILIKAPDSTIPASTNHRTGHLPPARRGSSAEPGADSNDWEEISGEKGMGSLRVEERAHLRALKSADPAVVVDLPSMPAAQDYEVASKNPDLSTLNKASPVPHGAAK
ncbi:MAG: hypothetical protein M1836_004197 [Candelina mexicana]|nr:MAG: hypothetical protein M1836_004197 [Candelina mexicana]